METKHVRENRKMRLFTVATAALLVVLAGYGIAGASVLTLSVQFADTQLSLDGTNGPTSTTYTVYGVVTDNTTEDGFGGTLNGGILSYETNQAYTGAGTIEHVRAAGPPIVFNAATTSQAPFTALAVKGTLDPASGTTPGTAGVAGTYGTAALPSDKFDYYTSADPYQMGNGTPVALYTGSITALADGAVTVNIDGLGNTLVWTINGSGLQSAAPDTIVGATATLNVGNVGPTPTFDITTPDVTEADWSGPGGWNNPARMVHIAGQGTGGAGALTYEWKVTNNLGETQTLDETTAEFDLTIGELMNKFGTLPPPYASGATPGSEYYWTLIGTASDGTATSDPASISLFVPEPATIALLGFGVVGLLKRRRA
jgi:hypothetical protein